MDLVAESAEYDGLEISDQRLKKVVHRKKKPATMDVEDESNLEKKMPQQESESELSLAEAAAKIDPSHLAAYLNTTPIWLMGLELIDLVDYFGKKLSRVSSSVQFPWPNMDQLIDMIDHPVSELPHDVCDTVSDWIDQLPIETVASFILWSFDYIGALLDGKPIPPKSHVSVFVTLTLVLRTKPYAYFAILRLLRTEAYQAEDKLPVTVWMMAQVSQVDLCLGLYSWAYNLLPLVGKLSPRSMDLLLQLVESILSYPNARTILVNDSVKKGNARLISLPSFEILLRLTFPDSSQRVNDTKRFEAVYPLLKELALADAPGRKATKHLTQQIFTFSLKLAGEGNPVLAKEATSIAIWCVTKNVDCCNQWDNVYKKNLEASVALLKKLVDEWKDHSHRLSSSPSDTLTLNRTMKSFMLKNKKHITARGGANASLYKEADKYSKQISGRLSRGSGFPKGIAISAVLLVAAVAAAPVVLFSNLMGSFDPHEYINAITIALKY